jgi:putative acetyltransferase
MTLIRPETPADREAIYAVNQQAYDGREAEPGQEDAIRESIATEGGRGEALALAPMAVLPGHQRRGLGSALVRHGLEAARGLGHAIVIVLGHPDFYPRFGFSAALARPLACPYGEPGPAWMALELVPGALDEVRGQVVYPPAFDGV